MEKVIHSRITSYHLSYLRNRNKPSLATLVVDEVMLLQSPRMESSWLLEILMEVNWAYSSMWMRNRWKRIHWEITPQPISWTVLWLAMSNLAMILLKLNKFLVDLSIRFAWWKMETCSHGAITSMVSSAMETKMGIHFQKRLNVSLKLKR